MFSTFLFFFLSNNCEPLINSYGTHPHPIIRFEITTIFLKNIVEDNISTAEFKTALQFAVPEFLKTIKYHFGGEDILAYRQKFKSTEVNEMKIIIQDYLEKNPSLNRNRVPDIG
jgi:hypothetical protein